MQRATSIGSRITWFVIAAIIIIATCLMGLRVLPMAREVFASFGIKLPVATQAVCTFGPAVLVLEGLLAAALLVIGEFKPALRSFRAPLIFIVVLSIGSSLAAVFFVPPMRCGEIITPSPPASTSPSHPTNAP
jgi:type II secretory pathway component PulF